MSQRVGIRASPNTALRDHPAVWKAFGVQQQKAAKGSKGQRPPGSWYRASDDWEWQKRAAEFDRKVFHERAADVQAMSKEERRRRRMIVSELGRRIEQLLDRDRIGMSSPEIALLRTYLDASVEEFGPTRADVPQPVSEPLRPGELEQIMKLMNEQAGQQVG